MLTEIKNLGNMDVEIGINKDYVNMTVAQISLLHYDDDRFITIAVKNDSANRIYNRGEYNYKNEILMDKLCITQEEMKKLSEKAK